jgi:RimJ/RimL family protein N-acetyltransferase
VNPNTIGEIRTIRLILHPLEVADAAEMVGVLAQTSLYEFTGGEAPDLDTLERRYRSQVAGPVDRNEGWYNWIVRRTEDGQPVGFIQATSIADGTDVAWLIGVEFQGIGFASEAAQAVCEWLIGRGVSRITAHIDPDHAASQRVAMAAGLTETDETDNHGETVWATATAR